jgi:NADH-quinone oxidoreductase subunit E
MSGSPAEAIMNSPFTYEQEQELVGWRKRYPHPNMGLIEALRAVQGWHKMISPKHAERVAAIFELPFNRVWSVATFFPTFTQKATGRRRVGLCHGLTCWLAGSDKMSACLEKTLGIKDGETTPDGQLSWETMECLGACDHAPALLVDDRLRGVATEEDIKRLAGESQ